MDTYNSRGVSSRKEDVHEAIKNLDKGLFPNAFCKILPDIVAKDPLYCNIMHSDTAGTKTSLAYVYWKETGDISVWKGIVQDSLVMNIDDLACVGAINNLVISSTIGRNKNIIPGTVIKSLINGTQEFLNEIKSLGLDIHLAGGETADVGDIVRTLDVGFTIFSRMKKKEVIDINIQEGNVIVGLSSTGQSSYETEYNSGIGSNGLTSARHDIFANYLAKKYPESFNPLIPENLVYSGSKNLTDLFVNNLSYGKMALSPTRTYLPVLKSIFLNCDKSKINGIIHCTGGGQTKVLHFINRIHVVKDNLFDTPEIFNLIAKESKTSYSEMYSVFNMGHRMEFYTDKNTAKEIIQIAQSLNIEAKIIGECFSSPEKKLTIKSHHGEFTY
ncbi:MAG: phosphoribosylformylglycinamidine cyclo-ligase [Flavobacteriales bacterium]|nr:phosphoribosylformylglycinamidine cyclo-ligase [Flavobacteriales bacterium]|tara:strand:+ start:1457 stop:2614 length:1158 start_codon:yes stop_codon:yes gene_type:complete